MKSIIRGIIIGIACIAFISCSGLGVNWSSDVLTVVQKSTTSTVGYLIAKNNPEYIDDMIKWYTIFNTKDNFVDIQEHFQDGIGKLSALISDDQYLQLQVKNLAELIEITYDGPQIPEEVSKYKMVVDSFMDGVIAAKAGF